MSRPLQEPSLAAVHVLHLLEVVERWNVTASDLLEGEDLTPDALAAPDATLPIPVVERLVARARALTGEPALGLYLGLQMRVSAHGYLGFAAMTAATVREALELATRYTPTRTSALGLRLHVDGNLAAVVYEELAPLGTARDVIILSALIGVGQIARALLGRETNGVIDVAFAEPPYMARFPHKGQLRFGQPLHQLVFDAALLDLPLPMADPAALRLAREQCERALDALGTGDGAVVGVRQALRVDAGGFRSLDEIAVRLGVSPRTLKRRLAESGTSYSALLENERRARALLLLRSEALSVDEIALRLGYSDAANFTRAFRRWTGHPPGHYRRNLTGPK